MLLENINLQFQVYHNQTPWIVKFIQFAQAHDSYILYID